MIAVSKRGNQELAGAVDHLLIVGFYLINIGCIVPALKTDNPMSNFRETVELESVSIGLVLLIPGAMSFNIQVFAKMRARGGSQPDQPLAPFTPQEFDWFEHEHDTGRAGAGRC